MLNKKFYIKIKNQVYRRTLVVKALDKNFVSEEFDIEDINICNRKMALTIDCFLSSSHLEKIEEIISESSKKSLVFCLNIYDGNKMIDNCEISNIDFVFTVFNSILIRKTNHTYFTEGILKYEN